MTDLGLNVLDRTVHDVNVWLNEIGDQMEHPDKQVAYHALRGVLFALRDRITVDEAADFAAQLPLLIRGMFYEGYKPSGKPDAYRDQDEWLRRVAEELEQTGGENPEKATRAVFAVLVNHVTEGELEDVRQMLPEGVREYWPTDEAVTA